jgi:hypothetical protein
MQAVVLVKTQQQKTQPQDIGAMDRLFWLAIRAALIQMAKAIERRYLGDSHESC